MPTIDPAHPLAKLLKTDKRYKFDAYVFVFESLNYAHEQLGLGQEHPPDEEVEKKPAPKRGKAGKAERHLTGQQLCEAIRQYAQEQYGLMAKAVLASWGVRSTGDIGNIVFNLIEIEQMRKTKHDRREDFENVFDFDQAFVRDFKIVPPQPAEQLTRMSKRRRTNQSKIAEPAQKLRPAPTRRQKIFLIVSVAVLVIWLTILASMAILR